MGRDDGTRSGGDERSAGRAAGHTSFDADFDRADSSGGSHSIGGGSHSSRLTSRGRDESASVLGAVSLGAGSTPGRVGTPGRDYVREHAGCGTCAAYDPAEYAGTAPAGYQPHNGAGAAGGTGAAGAVNGHGVGEHAAPGAPGGSAQLLVLGGVLTNTAVTAEHVRNSPPPRVPKFDDIGGTDDAGGAAQVAAAVHTATHARDAAVEATQPALNGGGGFARDGDGGGMPPSVPEPRPSGEPAQLRTVPEGGVQLNEPAGGGAQGMPPPPACSRQPSLQSSACSIMSNHRLYTPPVVPGGMGLSMSGLSLSHASPPHALIASRKGSKAGGSTATEQPAGGGDEAGGAGAGASWQGGGDGGGTEQVRPAGAGGSEDLDLMYDPMLNCYYDPRTNKYYELA